MTKQNENSDELLNELYAKRKSQHKAPSSIKRKMLAKQQESQATSLILRRISYVALAASTLLLMSLLLSQQPKHSPTELTFQQIQLHSLDTEQQSFSDSISQRHAEHYHRYLTQKAAYAAHHKTRASLQLIDDGWQLTSCSNQKIQLSNELIAALKNIQQIDPMINNGDAVDIAFAQTGIILGITRSGNHLMC